MFEKFGEFESVEELNEYAAGLKAKGDEKALVELAEENGLSREDAEDYMDDVTTELATSLLAAIGKIKMEAKHLEIDGILEDWENAILDMCANDKEMQTAVRKRDKSLCECMAKLIKFAFENKVQVSEKIVKICRVEHNGKQEPMRSPLYLGIPNKANVRKIVKEYYLG
jgi:hypothetical protein